MSTLKSNYDYGVQAIEDIYAKSDAIFRSVQKEEAIALFKVRFLMQSSESEHKHTSVGLARACAFLIGYKHRLRVDNYTTYGHGGNSDDDTTLQNLYNDMKKDGSIYLIFPFGYLSHFEQRKPERENRTSVLLRKVKDIKLSDEWYQAERMIAEICKTKSWDQETEKLALNLFIACTIWNTNKLLEGQYKFLAMGVTLLAARDQAFRYNLGNIASMKFCTLNVRGLRNWIDNATKRILDVKAQHMMRNPERVSRTQIDFWNIGTSNTRGTKIEDLVTRKWSTTATNGSNSDSNWRL